MVLAAIVGYILGSLPSAVWVGKFFRLDPRERGDGNPGWWNMRGLVGERAAAVVLVGDLVKGLLAALMGSLMWGPWWVAYVAVAFAVIGHAFPIFADFRGGRSAVTFVGAMLALTPFAAFLALAAGVAAILASRQPIVAFKVAALTFPLFLVLVSAKAESLATLFLMALVGLRFLFARRLTSVVSGIR